MYLASVALSPFRDGSGGTRVLTALQELYADGRGHLGDLPGGSEPAGSRVDAERHNGIGILIGHEQELARRIDAEVARGLSLS